LYANLAVRGRRLADVRGEQLEAALELAPDLASVIAGVNDLLRPRFDLDATLEHLDAVIGSLRRQGAVVITATFPDPSASWPQARPLRRRFSGFSEGLRGVAASYGAHVADLAAHPVALSPRLWTEDRLHLNAAGHRVLAGAMIDTLVAGEPVAAARTGPRVAPGVLAELRWAQRFLVPWVARRLAGRSSGESRRAKRPALLPVTEVDGTRGVR